MKNNFLQISLIIGLLLSPLPLFSFAEDLKKYIGQEVDKKTVEDVNKTLEKTKQNTQNPSIHKTAEETINQFHQNMNHLIQKWKEKIDYDPETGRLTIKGTVEDNLDKEVNKDIKIGIGENKFLSTSDRIYIFISSSIPKHILIEYAKQIVNLGLENRAVMMLRGCIGGCKYIKPTLKWISSILHENGKNKKGIPVQVWIDPLMFRMYKIDKVPCVVFAKNVNVYDFRLSEGLKHNLKNNPTAVISCGDWSLEYHLKQLYKKTKNKKLKAILDDIKHRGFYYGNFNSNQRKKLSNQK